MSNKKLTDSKKPYEDQVERLLKASDCNTLGELGKKLGFKSGNNLTNWKSRGIDLNIILEVYPTISVRYLKTGEPPMHYGRSQIMLDNVEDLKDHVEILKDRLNQDRLEEPDQDELKKNVQLKKQIDELSELLNQRIHKLIE
ncbi:MAG: hypothetical protein CL666_14520 [Balneola sp.]|nr:hypothetical protein [Balneola sp.]|tara:strand:- start:49174 stop:49599 length:426 start_codon:yes stop_codon:yes gene_type:complete